MTSPTMRRDECMSAAVFFPESPTLIRHPEVRPRPLEPGEPRRATATDLGFTRDRHINVPKSAIADLGAVHPSRAAHRSISGKPEIVCGHLRMTDPGII